MLTMSQTDQLAGRKKKTMTPAAPTSPEAILADLGIRPAVQNLVRCLAMQDLHQCKIVSLFVAASRLGPLSEAEGALIDSLGFGRFVTPRPLKPPS